MTGVRTTHKDYDALSPKVKRCRDIIAGEDAVHAAGETYLPKLQDETDSGYKKRLDRSDFFNASWRTIAGLKGMAFRKAPTVTVPDGLKPLLDDVTMAGVRLDALAGSIVEDVLSVGRIGLLVDHPPRPANVEAITVNAAQAMGLRPMMQVYPTESVINWRFARINNQWTLALVVLKESANVSEDEFEEKVEDRFRVLDLIPNALGEWTYRQRLFRINDKGEDEQIGDDIFPLMNSKTLPYIPFRIVSACGTADGVDDPPLIDLIDANKAHYQVNSDYRHGLHFTGLPTPYVTGYQQDPAAPDSFYIGSSAAWVFAQPEAKVGFLEFTGQGLGAMEKALEKLERRMAVLGARMLADETQAAAETLGGTQIKRAGENSILADIVISVSEAIEWALRIFAEWAGVSGEISYSINREFLPVMLDAQQLTALVGAWQQGALSEGELFENLKRGDVIDSAKTLDEHQEEVGQGGPARPAKPGLAA
ncbi:DUF4055 domain-containing protein [Sphingobium bisphenolivorans]|uniref:DUF4055 domain-containing protein n=1 Tax=Sphingobium bisphenolivorans TaxID=1335760 RepID=UPI0003B3A8F9|nr:DUF4055 domain-containing protein [Sphingobium bisphenolivorans]